jgi:hypothetical protein
MVSRKTRFTMLLATIAAVAVAESAAKSYAEDQPAVRFLSVTGQPLPADWAPDSNAATCFVIHGFRARGTDAGSLRQAAAIGRHVPEGNVVVVDYQVPPSPCSNGNGTDSDATLWGAAIAAAQQVSRDCDTAVKAAPAIAEEIVQWMKLKEIDPAKTILYGHSLGAQIAGYVGRDVARPQTFGRRLAKICAADPAGPSFRERPEGSRLGKTDALEVIVVHTTETFGDNRAIGTVDMYVSWPASDEPDVITAHSQAREILTDGLLPVITTA